MKQSLLDKLAHLSPEKRALVLQKLSQKGLVGKKASGQTGLERILTAPTMEDLPLSFSQLRLWFLDKMAVKQEERINICAGLRLTGVLNEVALTEAISMLVRRHHILRTRFLERRGEPYQEVVADLQPAFQTIDLTRHAAHSREADARTILEREAVFKFDLTNPPLLRVTLVKMAPEEHLFFVNMNHIIADGWSVGVMIREFAASYSGLVDGKPAGSEPLALQYGDYAYWQRKRLSGEMYTRLADYWRNKLGGHPPLDLPMDRPKSADAGLERAKVTLLIDADLADRLRSMAQDINGSLFMVLLAGYKVLLASYARQDDLSVGSFIAGRDRTQLRDLIGVFINTLVLRTSMHGQPTFSEILDRVRETMLDAYANQEFPFEKILEELQASRNLFTPTLFETMFVLQNAPRVEMSLPGLSVQRYRLTDSDPFSTTPIAVAIHEQPGGALVGMFEYDPALFDAATIERMSVNYYALLAQAGNAPDTLIGDLLLMTGADQKTYLEDFNQTEKAFPDRTIHELFEANVGRHAQSIAIKAIGEQLTYADLNTMANRLAHHLIAQGVKPGQIVAVLLPRSPDLIVALLAVLKAGAAYLPLDLELPHERLAFMLSDSDSCLVLTSRQHTQRLPDGGPAVLLLDDHDTSFSGDNPGVSICTSSLVYVIYTSGSTGKPKGVGISHRNLVAYVTGAIESFELCPGEAVLQFASISFDTAAEEIFPCLLAGCRLVLRTDDMISSINGFLETCAREEIAMLDLPTAFWHLMVVEFKNQGTVVPAHLRLVILGGEKALPQHLAHWRELVPDRIRLLNTYGPTEATIVATSAELTGNSAPANAANCPIGKPVANDRVFVTNHRLQATTPGIPGELCLGGEGVARGYLGRPAMTAERFIPDPFSRKPGSRLYRSGDLVRFSSHGNLEFMGRVDHQVKIRGFRVELGEIEDGLSAHPAVREAVVTSRRDKPGGPLSLAAYVVFRQGRTASPAELRTHLNSNLPNYMIPASITVVHDMPRTPGGKVNRRALPDPAEMRQAITHQDFQKPEGPAEVRVAAIWEEVLERSSIGALDNFFEVGGHSLLATQVLYRLNKTFEVHVTLRDLFEEPTVAGLALLVEELILDQLEAE